MLTVSNLSIHFANRYLFDEVTFTIGDNDRIGLIGRNGTGKSTLLKIIAGEQIAEEGRIIKSNEYRIGYLPQDGNLESELGVFAEAKKALDEIIELEKRIHRYDFHFCLGGLWVLYIYPPPPRSYTTPPPSLKYFISKRPPYQGAGAPIHSIIIL